MTPFLQEFLQEKPPASGGDKAVFVAAFGKHPGWNDHFWSPEATRSLRLVREKLYLEGIRGLIESPKWNKAPAGERVEFNHVFLWSRSRQFLAGRLWASEDGTRDPRRRYPMVVSAHCFDAPESWGIRRVLPALEELGAACRAVATGENQAAMPAQVLDLVAKCERSLQQSAPPEGSAPDEATLNPSARSEFIRSPDFGKEQSRLYILLHRLERRLFAYAPAGQGSSVGDPLPQHLRLPLAASSSGDAFALWRAFLRPHLDERTPVLLILPVGGGCLDMIVGEPTGEDFACLGEGYDARAPDDTSELATEEFRAKASRIIQAFADGESTPPLFAEARDKKAGGLWNLLRRALPEKPPGT